VGLCGICTLAQGRSHTLRVERNGAPLFGVRRGVARSQGVGRAEPAPQGSGVLNLRPRGRASHNLPPGGQVKPWSRPLSVRSILIVGDCEFPFFGYPKISTRHRRMLQVCLFRCYICFTHMLQVFYIDVANVFQWVLSVFRCFCKCLRCMFQVFHLRSDVC
jgi:hypothetical protein